VPFLAVDRTCNRCDAVGILRVSFLSYLFTLQWFPFPFVGSRIEDLELGIQVWR